MPGDHHALDQLRTNLRPQLEKGQTTRGGPLGDDWLKKNWPKFLDAHYECRIPGPSVCLQDALKMITEPHSVQITCPGAKKKEDEHKEGDEHKPRTLSELEVQVIEEWYNKKDRELEETRGEAYITERNLSAAARQYHNDSMNAHAKTYESLAEIRESLSHLHQKIHTEKGKHSKKRKRDAMAELPKKAETAYCLFLAANKAEFVKAAGGNYKQDISKAAKAWKELSAAEKKPFEDEAAERKVQYHQTTFPSERKHHLCPAGHCLVSVPGYEHEEGCQVSLCDIGHETDITSAPTTLDACHGAVTAPSWAHAILGTFDKAQLAQLEANCSSEDPITLGGDCMGGNAPWFAVTACQQAFRDQTGRRLVFKNTFGSEAPLPLGAAPLRFLQKNATPDTLFCDLKARTNSGDTFWPGGKQPCVRVKMYQSGWVCWDFSSANTLAPKQLDMVETSGSGESTKTLNGSLRYMSQFKPPVNLLENVFRKQALYGARAKLIAKDETDPFLKKKIIPKCL